jgi:hypothetical protein
MSKFANVLESDYRPLCRVRLPFEGRRKYMMEVNLDEPTVPEEFDDYLDPIISLCAAAGGLEGAIVYVTVDEKVIAPGMSQRRPKPHVDGCYVPKLGKWGGGSGWTSHNEIRMPVIVASSVPGCRAWRGDIMGVPKEDGDLSHIQPYLGEGEILPANVGYLLSPDCVHESMIFEKETKRSFLRIALPVDYEFKAATSKHPGKATPDVP